MPFCQNCGAEVELGDAFCGSCGAKLVAPSKRVGESHLEKLTRVDLKGVASRALEQSKVLKGEIETRLKKEEIKKPLEEVAPRRERRIQPSKGSFINFPGMESFSEVLSWVLRKHAEALSALTTEFAPYMASHVVVEGNKTKLGWEWESQGTVKNLLLRLPFTDLPLQQLADFAEVKKGVDVPAETMRKIKEKTEEVIEAYTSTWEALEALDKSSHPLFNSLTDFAEISRKDDITNLKKLRKFEKVARDLKKSMGKTDWSRFPQEDYSHWIDEASECAVEVIGLEVETNYYHVLYQYPWISGLGFDTDIERYVVPFFIFIDTIDETYLKCVELFEKCKNESGFMTGPSKDIKEAAIEALSNFNVQYHGIYSAYSYSSFAEKQSKKKGYVRDEGTKILNTIEKSLRKTSKDGNVKNAHDIIKKLYEFVKFLNQVEPVTKRKAHYAW